MTEQPLRSEKLTTELSSLLRNWQSEWPKINLDGADPLWLVREWLGSARFAQYPLQLVKDTWLVIGGRGAGKTRVGAEWVNGLVRGFSPFSLSKYGQIALVGETYSDVREVMIGGPSGIASIARHDRPRYEVMRRRLLWSNGAVAQIFSAENHDGLRGPQFEAAWCDELGCAAMDKGPNQPNVFGDPKSSENPKPHFSSGGRSDIAQHRFIDAHIGHWDDGQSSFSEANNPVSSVYAGRMVDASRMYLWAWDARPFPAFPLQTDVWSDGENWLTGHWLNGRMSSVDLGDLINAILVDHGLPVANVSAVDGTLSGYISDNPDSARAALEPLIDLFGLAVSETAGKFVIFSDYQPPEPEVVIADLVSDGDEAVMRRVRGPDHEHPNEVVLHFRDPMQEFQAVSARRLSADSAQGRRQSYIALAGLMEASQGEALAGDWLRRRWTERDTAAFSLPPSARSIQPGSFIRLAHCDGESDFLVTAIDDGLSRQVEARRLVRLPPHSDYAALPASGASSMADTTTNPLAIFLDLPMTGSSVQPHQQLRVAAWSKPWRPQVVSVSPEETGYLTRSTIPHAAWIGVLEAAIGPGPSGRIDNANVLTVKMISGEFASTTRTQLLNGANAIAVQADNGGWELVQFELATEVSAGSWLLTGLLRGQLGTEDAMEAGSAAGSFALVLDEAVQPAGLQASEIGLELNWRVSPSGLLVTGDNISSWSGEGGVRALTPLSPVHLRGE